MPFKCNLTLGESLKPGEELIFVEWIKSVWDSESEWGNIVPAGTPYIVVKKDGALGSVSTTFRVALMEKGKLAAGDILKSDTTLAIVACEGDEIAYGKPYSVFNKST